MSSPLIVEKVNSTRVHLIFLDGLRGICALYVVLHHFLFWSSIGVSPSLQRAIAWTAFGHFAVNIFIVLSGFSLMLQVASSPERNLRGGLINYLQRRSRRILPAYFGALIFSILVLIVIINGLPSNEASSWKNDLSIGSITSHFLIVHNLFSSWSLSINMAHWTIATEWQIYFIFPLVLLPVWRYKQALCIPVGLLIGLAPHFLLSKDNNLDWACPWFVTLFSMGMMVATYHSSNFSSLKLQSVWLIGIFFSALAYILFKAVLHGDQYAWIRDLCAGSLVSCFIAWCGDSLKIKNGQTPLVIRILESRLCIVLGSFSYSLYLTHCAVLNFFNAVALYFQFTPDAALYVRFFLGVPIAIALSYAFFLYFERPFLSKRVAV
jgi:peptidoglycan/LPS O-acetylase OafA/YrhL